MSKDLCTTRPTVATTAKATTEATAKEEAGGGVGAGGGGGWGQYASTSLFFFLRMAIFRKKRRGSWVLRESVAGLQEPRGGAVRGVRVRPVVSRNQAPARPRESVLKRTRGVA